MGRSGGDIQLSRKMGRPFGPVQRAQKLTNTKQCTPRVSTLDPDDGLLHSGIIDQHAKAFGPMLWQIPTSASRHRFRPARITPRKKRDDCTALGPDSGNWPGQARALLDLLN